MTNIGRMGRPRWDTEEDRRQIKQWLDEGKSYGWIGRQYVPVKQASVISKLAKEQGWTSQHTPGVNREVHSKTCVACLQDKLIDEFPWRHDRPGKRHARCHLCRALQTQEANMRSYMRNADNRIEYSRQYRQNNPEKHREAVRRRAKRKRKVRREGYTVAQIRERDRALCYFCKGYVDNTLKYPHPMSQVIHHLLPFSKLGPDVPSNVALAHAKCNSTERAKYSSPFANEQRWSVRPITSQIARQVALEMHYLHRKQNVSYAYGLYDNGTMIGMVSFGSTSSYRTAMSACHANPKLVIELTRLWIDNDAPPQAASWFVSRALKQLPPYIVISYADTGVLDSRNERNHDGSVYRALSFNYAGCTKASIDWQLPGSTRNVGKKTPGSTPVRITAKHRYWTTTGGKRDKRKLNAICDWPALPYDLIT